MPAAPSIQNYHIGKGVVSFKEDGAVDFLDLGNAPSFIYTPTGHERRNTSARARVSR